MKKNCWEVKACERCITILGGEACPVCREAKLHGTHGGVNGGRACWTVPHTKCGGISQGSVSNKSSTCIKCNFYNMVKEEEKASFQFSIEDAV